MFCKLASRHFKELENAGPRPDLDQQIHGPPFWRDILGDANSIRSTALRRSATPRVSRPLSLTAGFKRGHSRRQGPIEFRHREFMTFRDPGSDRRRSALLSQHPDGPVAKASGPRAKRPVKRPFGAVLRENSENCRQDLFQCLHFCNY